MPKWKAITGLTYLTKNVEREVFCEIDGISIYHLYRNDDAEERLNFHFSTTPEEDDRLRSI
jgi:hypothetical protein